MVTGYALAFITKGNSFHRLYGVFYIDPERPEVIQRFPIDGGDGDPSYFGRNIARYHMNNKEALPFPISFEKPPEFPTVGQLRCCDFTIETVFEPLTGRELRRTIKDMMKTLEEIR